MYRPVRKLGKNEVPGMDGAHTVQHSSPHLVYKESYVFLMNYLNDTIQTVTQGYTSKTRRLPLGLHGVKFSDLNVYKFLNEKTKM